MGKPAKRLLFLPLVLALAVVSWWLGTLANAQIREGLRLARTPISAAGAILPGPAAAQGQAQSAGAVLKGPFSGEPCLYYRTLVEEKVKGSDGKTQWKTLEDQRRFVSFELRDESGAVRLDPRGADIRAPRVHQHVDDDRRHSEYALRGGDALFVFGLHDGEKFNASEGVPLLISRFGEKRFAGDKGVKSLLLCVVAIVCASFAVFFVCFALRLHHIFTYLSLVATFVPTWLFLQWFDLTRVELLAAHERLAAAAKYCAAQPADTLRSALLKQTYNDGVERYDAYRVPLPNRLVAAASGVGALPAIALSTHEAALAAPYPLPERPPVGLNPGAGIFFAALGTGALIGLTVVGFRRLRAKRLIENLPTSKAAGVVVGLSELSGTPRREDDWLTSRYTRSECAWFRYRTRERRGSGKNARWVTIESGENRTPFWLVDASGAIRVDPDGADVTGRRVLRERDGRRVKEEWIVDTGDALYVLGPAKLADADDEQLSIARDEHEPRYLISIESEADVMLSFARTGFLLTNFALIGGTVAVLCALALRGFSPFAFFLSGLFPPLYLSFLAVFFLYNDLIYLRERTRRARAMIDVALARRADLLPNLVDVARESLRHERGIQAELAAMRTAPGRSTEQVFASQQRGIPHLLALIEAHPELKGSAVMLDLQHRLAQLENEIAFARQSHNDAVERFNTRAASFPELLIARVAGMRPAGFFAASAGERRPIPVATTPDS